MSDVQWDIRREGRPWIGDEAQERYFRGPEKVEMTDGKLYWDDEQRLLMLGLLLENVGVDAAVRFGNPEVWRAAVAEI